MLTPNDVITFAYGLSIAKYDKNLVIFVDTENSEIVVMVKPVLSKPPEPTTHIGLLSIQPTTNKGSQTKPPNNDCENKQLIHMCSRKPTILFPQLVKAQLKIPDLCQVGHPSSHEYLHRLWILAIIYFSINRD